jgi:uncharacterized membrane protein
MDRKKIFRLTKDDTIQLLLIALMFLIGFLAYSHLPDQIPTHWNIRGEVDGYGSRTFGALGIPLITLGIFFLFRFLPSIDPRKRNYVQFAKSYRAIKLVFIIFMFTLYSATILFSLGYPVNITFVVNLLIGILFIVIGNYLGKVKHNYFVGIKTPWTLADEEVWKKTHRLAAPLMVGAGVSFTIGALVRHPATFILSFSMIMVAVLVPTVYSYLLFKKRHPDKNDN